MSWLSSLFPRQWRNINLSVILFCSILLIVGGQTFNSLVSQVVYTSLFYPFFKIRIAVENLQTVNEENEKLKEALVEASVKLSAYEEIVMENERFRTILAFEQPSGYKLIPVKVIEVTRDVIPTLVAINVGSADSILLNQTVINKDGLVGKIVSLSPNYSTVQLLTHPANKVAARVADTRDMGIVEVHASKGMILKNVPVQSTIEVGDEIISSGLGGVYPPGIKIATVSEVIRNEDEPYCEVKLTPTANFNTIDELFVMKIME